MPLFITTGAGLLSLHFTVRACRGLSPADSVLEVGAFGVLGEAAKLYFGPRALLGILSTGHPWARLGCTALLALVLVLIAGSVGASFVFTTQAEEQAVAANKRDRAEALAEMEEYGALTADVKMYDQRIAGLAELAHTQRVRSLLTAAVATDRRLSELQTAKDTTVARRAALRGATAPIALPGAFRRWVHLAVAIALELVGIAACALLHADWPTAPRSTDATRKPGKEVGVPVHDRQRLPVPQPRSTVFASVGARFIDRYARARQLVEAGVIEPTVEALERAVGVSQRPAQRFQRALCAEGVIEWAGHRYRRCPHAAVVHLGD